MNDRARVPFALVGVLLLVTSGTLTATVGTHDPRGTAQVDRAVDGATAEAATALRGAADEAATEAAAAPVTRPSNTTAGRALDDDRAFRDALRLRLYLSARDRLEDVSVRRGDVEARASLPPVEEGTDGYRAAIERVRVERAGEDGAALRVEIEGVTLTATRDGKTVAEDERAPSFVVANPALLLHDRTARYERRANAAVTEPGMARRLTSRLYLVGWTRGYAQYGGAPIQSVVGTRHVELATNDALLAEQRSVFGEADPDGHRGVAAAGRRVATEDLLEGSGVDREWTDVVLNTTDEVGAAPPDDPPLGGRNEERPDPTVTVGVNGTADGAYAELVGIEGDDELASIVDRVHTVEARLVSELERGPVRERTEAAPGPGWERIDETTDRRIELVEADGYPPRRAGWVTTRGAAFDATVTETTTRTWRNADETTETTETTERDLRVRVAVVVRTPPIEGTPTGDPLGALAGAAERASERTLARAGGLRGSARSAAAGDPTTAGATVRAEPTIERDRLLDDVRELRERTRDVDASVPAPAVGAGRANPPARLREELAGRTDELRGEGGSVPAERAVRASRVAYLDAVDARLATAAERHDDANGGIEGEVLEELDGERLDGALAAHRMAERGDADELRDPAGELSLAVDTAPGYLPTSRVTCDRMDARGDCDVHPLTTRNVNVFTSPHDQVAESIVDRIPVVGSDGVALSTAATTLAALDELSEAERRALDRSELERLERERRDLREEVEEANAHVRGELIETLEEEGVSERPARSALETDASTAEEALALSNGTTGERAASELGGGPVPEDRLRVRLTAAGEEALRDEQARPSWTTTNETAGFARELYREALEERVAAGVEAGVEEGKRELLGERLGSLPAGLPVAPVPGYWYATANVWYVETGGTYERFAVRSDRGTPTGETTYVRRDRTVELDRDGRSIQLGVTEPISFDTETAVVVAVPPGGRGVGDVDGVVDERSEGWESDPSPNHT